MMAAVLVDAAGMTASGLPRADLASRGAALGLRRRVPLVPVVQAADPRPRDDVGFSVRPPLHRSPCGCRLAEAQVGPVIVVVCDVLAEEPARK
jgi:hypothetical protein